MWKSKINYIKHIIKFNNSQYINKVQRMFKWIKFERNIIFKRQKSAGAEKKCWVTTSGTVTLVIEILGVFPKFLPYFCKIISITE